MCFPIHAQVANSNIRTFEQTSWCFRKVLLAVLSADFLAASLVSPSAVILCFQWALVFTGQMHTHTNAVQHEDSSLLVC